MYLKKTDYHIGMRKFLILLVAVAIITPHIVLASWWNPFSWFKKQTPQPAPQAQTINIKSQETTTSVNNKSAQGTKTLKESKAVVVTLTQTIQKSDLYSVIKVVDGDTLSVNIDGTITTIRLIGINTPETVDPRKLVECFGTEASNKAKQLLSGQKIKVEKDPSQGERDKYGRLLAYIFLENGVHFNKYMIEEGYAYEYTYNLPYKYQSEFKQAEQSAQAQKRGLWADGVCSTENTTTETAPPTFPFPSVSVPPQVPMNTSGYICTYNAYNCPDFSTHAEAQAVYEACGGVNNDIHRLDQDKDSLACESLP